MVSHDLDDAFAAYVNAAHAGKTIARAEAVDTRGSSHMVRIHFTDGTTMTIESVYDQGFTIREARQ